MQRLPRSESHAYPKTSQMLGRIQFLIRQNSRAAFALLAFCVFVVVISSDHLHDAQTYLKGSVSSTLGAINWGGATQAGYFKAADAVKSDGNFKFAIVTDLDELSRIPGSSKPEFQAFLLPGTLKRTGKSGVETYEMDFEAMRSLKTKHNEAGRGGEFSELTLYNDRLVTFDDRTGDVFEVLNTKDGSESFVVPRFVVTEGSGETDKGMKWEWASVKDGELYMGSMGKEYTNSAGEIVNTNNLWIAVLNERGELRREDWKEKYGVVRKALDASAPGYIIIEACLWSEALKKWIFLPRRISHEAYDDVRDEKMGGDKLVLVDEGFTKAEVVDIKFPEKMVDGYKGFSTFAFVPGTKERHAITVRTIEEDCAIDDGECKQSSYFFVFDILSGEVLSDEYEASHKMKFEGIEFVDLDTTPPAIAAA